MPQSNRLKRIKTSQDQTEIKDADRRISSSSAYYFSTTNGDDADVSLDIFQSPNLLTIPPEILIHICKHLPPIDLLSLARVCKLFNEYLCTDESITTQHIWRESRLNHVRFLQLPPPEGMSELRYCRLVLEKGCQLCGTKLTRKVYWEFQVRCCTLCFDTNTLSEWDVIHKDLCNVRIQDILPAIKRASYALDRFWKPHLQTLYKEFETIPEDKRLDWLKAKNEKLLIYNKDVSQRQNEERKERANRYFEHKKRSEDRAKFLLAKFQEDLAAEVKEDGQPVYKESYIRECPSFKKACVENSRPFTQRCWKNLKRKLREEHKVVEAKKIEEENENQKWRALMRRIRPSS
ncbi:7405_t:CDS:2 [Ambispora gerdemannii]|uniref:7405_t:CDS:1 n=1 Tax=Ambispora gerdemannii TaxID=144530 RepID=A0A9N8V217_9GLOM|nr:7405_t:CDS:2 [Ambispora gerdemannii]